jgi:mRNA interferase MazF
MHLRILKRLIMQIKQFEIWIADLNPQIGTEPGKTRPVLVIQSNLLNKIPHPSTIVCPLTTNVEKQAEILRVHLRKGMANLLENCDIMIDQVRSIDNKRLVKRVGELPQELIGQIKENLSVILDLE